MMMKKSSLIIILFILAIIFMTVGFARYNKTINWNGTAIVKPDGKVYLKSVTLTTHTETASATPSITQDGNVDFDLSFHTTTNPDTQYNATFEIVIANESSYDYIYNAPVYEPTVVKDGVLYNDIIDYQITGLSHGDTVPKRSERTITITFTFTNPTTEETGIYEVDGNFIPDVTEDLNSKILAAVDTSITGDLRGNNTVAAFSVHVTSTYDESKTFTVVADSSKYAVTNSNGVGTPSFSINANSESDFTFHLKKVDGAEYNASRERVRIYVVPTGGENINAGLVNVLVDVTEYDTEPPVISNVVATVENTDGSVTVSWAGTDNSESIDTFTIITFTDDGTQVGNPLTISASNTSHTFTGLAEGDYFFVVFGEDSSGNTATAAQIEAAKTSTATSGVACRSATVNAKWTFSVTHQTDGHVNYTGTNTAQRGTAYSTRLTSNDTNNYSNPTRETITVTIGGVEYTGYTLSNNNTLTIQPPITGNIIIQVAAVQNSGGGGTCFAEGTKILLANGKYKNIEDIRYTDLLKVYDHVNGGTTEVYPAWLEKEGLSGDYRKITFSDGTDLKIVHKHAIFDVDKKRFINIANDEECKVGTRVYKWKNNKLEIVTITKVEDIIGIVKRYNIVSTNYYNVIANDVIATDLTASLYNLYGFNEKALFGDKFYELQKEKSLPYFIVSFIPHYLYKGLNLEHAGVFLQSDISNTDIDLDFAINVIKNDTLPPIVKDGKQYFIVTTSLDTVNENNVDDHLYEEGSYYTLPTKGAKYFVDTFTNIKYKPGEKIKVENNIHLKAVK